MKAVPRRRKPKSSLLPYLGIHERVNSGQLDSIHSFQIYVFPALPNSSASSGCLLAPWPVSLHFGGYFQALLLLWMRTEDRKRKTTIPEPWVLSDSSYSLSYLYDGKENPNSFARHDQNQKYSRVTEGWQKADHWEHRFGKTTRDWERSYIVGTDGEEFEAREHIIY